MAEIGMRRLGAWIVGVTLGTGCAGDLDGWEAFDSEAASSDAEPEDDAAEPEAGSMTGDADPGDTSDTGDDAHLDETGTTGAPSDVDDGGSTGEPEVERRVRVEAGATKDAELVQTLPVAQSEGAAKRRVVLRLSPSELPDLASGDVLLTPAEVQVTTRCDVGQTAPGCGYDPKIRAQIILTSDPGDDDPGGAESMALSDPQTQTCTKNEHHCMFVFRPSQTTNTIEDLPCVETGDCHVNLVMWAWDSQARPGGQDEVIVGANEGNYLDNGIVESDRARLMAIREREITAGDRHEHETTGGGDQGVNTSANPVLVYAHPLVADGDLKAGEQFVVEAKIPVSVGGRARFSTEMFLTKNPNATDGHGLDGIAPEQIGEHNGINCLPSQSPCVTRKVAVFRATKDIGEPVYANVVVKSAVPGGGSTSVTVHRNDGWLRSTRYEAEHEG